MNKKVKIVCGLGFGDEGKGTIVDYLTSQADNLPLIVRFSDGAQAAHNVITETGLHHTFRQFGSGTLRGARTLLTQYTLVDPLILRHEAEVLSEKLNLSTMALVSIDGRAPLVTRIHGEVNRIRERARGRDKHGSTGLGMGETELYRITHLDSYPQIKDLKDPETLKAKLDELYSWAVSEVGPLELDLDEVFSELQNGFSESLNILSEAGVKNIINNAPELIFEGSQGALLDEWVGFHPHTTWSTVTPDNAFKVLEENLDSYDAEVIGVTRTYKTRHGAGPFPTEDNALNFGEKFNGYGEFQGAWRQGYLDLNLLEYAALQVMPDTIAVTHMDYRQELVATAYEEFLNFDDNARFFEDKDWQEEFTAKLFDAKATLIPIESNEELVKLIEDTCNAKASILSYGPKSSDKLRVKES